LCTLHFKEIFSISRKYKFIGLLSFYGINAFLFHLELIQEEKNEVRKKKKMFSSFSKVTYNLQQLKSLKSLILKRKQCVLTTMNNSIKGCAVVLSNTSKGQQNKRNAPD